MRLQKFLAHCGVDSRRKCEQHIEDGKVKVNGKIIKELGFKIDPHMDKVEFNNKVVQYNDVKMYILLNKPTGYVTTVKDEFNRKTVMDLLKDIDARIYPVGRLDYDTEGLLIMTNDGLITYRVTHPKYEIEKEYIALIKGIPSEEKIRLFRKGLKINNYITSPSKFSILSKKNNDALVKIIIHEGKNRQVRKMCDAIGHPVITLKRSRLGDITLGDLPTGRWRHLKNNELKFLKNIK